jgi:hypothetical protein
MTQDYVAWRGTGNEKISFKHLPDKAEIEHKSNFENL